MKYNWTSKEILDTRMYWIDHDLAEQKRRNARNNFLGGAYWMTLCSVVVGLTYLFSR